VAVRRSKKGTGQSRLFDRELSWLEWDARVLALVGDERIPLLERLRFTAIFSSNLDEYIERLRHDRDELDTLYRDLLIGVTHFFRDEEAFKILEERVLPELLERQPRDEAVRLWVAGCATGEEAYSLAITLQELMLKMGERPVKIFATDVHRGSLERAGRAIYEGTLDFAEAVKVASRAA